MIHPHLQEINIGSTKLSQLVSTFIVFTQSMIKGEHPRKRREPLNEGEQVCIWMKVILISIRDIIQSCPRVRVYDPPQLNTFLSTQIYPKKVNANLIVFNWSYLLLTFNNKKYKIAPQTNLFHFCNKNSRQVFLSKATQKVNSK